MKFLTTPWTLDSWVSTPGWASRQRYLFASMSFCWLRSSGTGASIYPLLLRSKESEKEKTNKKWQAQFTKPIVGPYARTFGIIQEKRVWHMWVFHIWVGRGSGKHLSPGNRRDTQPGVLEVFFLDPSLSWHYHCNWDDFDISLEEPGAHWLKRTICCGGGLCEQRQL